MVPIIGIPCDSVNATIYVFGGNYSDASISALGVVPIIGDGIQVVKKGKKVTKTGVEYFRHTDDVIDVEKNIKSATEEAIEKGELHITKITRPPRHHVFPQEHRQWFMEHGLDIDNYTIELDQGTHSALHRLNWNDEIMETLKNTEKSLNRHLTPDEILNIGEEFKRNYKIDSSPYIPYND